MTVKIPHCQSMSIYSLRQLLQPGNALRKTFLNHRIVVVASGISDQHHIVIGLLEQGREAGGLADRYVGVVRRVKQEHRALQLVRMRFRRTETQKFPIAWYLTVQNVNGLGKAKFHVGDGGIGNTRLDAWLMGGHEKR